MININDYAGYRLFFRLIAGIIGSNKKILRSFTLNLFFCGWFFDLFYRQQKFDEAMAKRGFMNTDIRNNRKA